MTSRSREVCRFALRTCDVRAARKSAPCDFSGLGLPVASSGKSAPACITSHLCQILTPIRSQSLYKRDRFTSSSSIRNIVPPLGFATSAKFSTTSSTESASGNYATSAHRFSTAQASATSAVRRIPLNSNEPAFAAPRKSLPLKRGEPLRVFVVAGEPSGDAIGCRLMAALRAAVHSRQGEIWEQVEERVGEGSLGVEGKGGGDGVGLRDSRMEERGCNDGREGIDRATGGDGKRDASGGSSGGDARVVQGRAGTVAFQGVGGPCMESEGLHSFFPMADLSAMGFAEIVPRIPLLWYRLRQAVRHVARFQPHVVVTIDSKGFNFRLLKAIRANSGVYRKDRHAPLCVHYVAPSFWAFKGGEKRLRHLAPFVDHLLCILPHEPATCQQHGIPATYVGHPSLEAIAEEWRIRQREGEEKREGEARGGEGGRGEVGKRTEGSSMGVKEEPWWKERGDGTSFRRQHGIPVGPQHIAICLLPGSRLQEVSQMLPIFLQTIEVITSSQWLREYLDGQGPGGTLSLVIPTLPRSSVVTARVQSILDSWLISLRNKRPSWNHPLRLFPSVQSNPVVDIAAAVVVPADEVDPPLSTSSCGSRRLTKTGPDSSTLAACDLAVCVSGSVVVEVLRSQVPLVVTYRAHWFTEFVVKQRVSVQYASLPNILLNKPLLPEILFADCTSHNLSSTIRIMLDNIEGCRVKQNDTANLLFKYLQEPVSRKTCQACDLPVAQTPSENAAQAICSLLAP